MSTSTYGDISGRLAEWSAKDITRRKGFRSLPRIFNAGYQSVKPLDVPCRYCKAQPGEGCTRWRRGKPSGNKYRAPRSPHPDRVYDATCASLAKDALLDGDA